MTLEEKARECIEKHTHKLVDKPTKQDVYTREESIFISGYKLGAKENGVVRHDLRQDPNDLPEVEGEYLICYQTDVVLKNTFILKWDKNDYGEYHWNDDYETYDRGIIA